jgi:hypothetical protein
VPQMYCAPPTSLHPAPVAKNRAKEKLDQDAKLATNQLLWLFLPSNTVFKLIRGVLLIRYVVFGAWHLCAKRGVK